MIKKIVRKILPTKILDGIRSYRKINWRLEGLEKNQQNLVRDMNEKLSASLNNKDYLKSRELRIFSQNGEDGILLYIFSKIGATNKTFIEFGIQDGRECNTANLSINFGWNGL